VRLDGIEGDGVKQSEKVDEVRWGTRWLDARLEMR